MNKKKDMGTMEIQRKHYMIKASKELIKKNNHNI